jgi:hypothetical protein
MLFGQTKAPNTPDNKSQPDRNASSSFIGDSRSKDATPSSFICENRSRETGSTSMFSRHQHSRATTTTLDKVPSAVAASDGSESNVSSVTEEASSFYKKSFGGRSPRWNEPAQKLVNNYNVRKNQLRTNNSFSGCGRDQGPSKFRQSTGSSGEHELSRSEAEHINVFRSEV